MNWASTNFTVLISQIKSLLNQLQSTAFEVSIHWTPGHATIAGNKIADRLAKDAAQQASKMPMDTSVVTNQDIKSAAKKSTISKWQQRWNISETGRFIYTFKPLVDGKLYLDLPSKDLFPIIHQLRTGYCKLNEYRFKLNQCESLECDCGEIETVQHFLLAMNVLYMRKNVINFLRTYSLNLALIIWIWIYFSVTVKMRIFLVGESRS